MIWFYGALAALGLVVVAVLAFFAISWAIYEARAKGGFHVNEPPKTPKPSVAPPGQGCARRRGLDLADHLLIRGQLERELGSLEFLPSDVWEDAPREDQAKPEASEDLLARWPEFMEEVRKRMEKGRAVYGDRSIRRPPAELRGEMTEELLDVLGWAYWLWLRVQAPEEASSSSARAKLLEAHPELEVGP